MSTASWTAATPPESGKGYIEELEAKMKEIGVGEIATVMGRYYAMDRDNRWDRVQKAYLPPLQTAKACSRFFRRGRHANSYKNGVTDEFVVPFVVQKNGAPTAEIKTAIP
jgi:2,3-bisphosphoglycerate-independent phosphoglycerate mutase